MTYYKIKKDYMVFTDTCRTGHSFIQGELVTLSELKKIGTMPDYRSMELVTVPKSKIFWNFGCRFEVRA